MSITEDRGADDERIVSAYDTLAGTYADHLLDELDHKPFDRWLLSRIANLAEGGPVADVGCGPGHIAAHLADVGADVSAFDLSPKMVAEATRRFPGLRVAEANFMDLPPPEGATGGWSAIVAWYALVHVAGPEVLRAVSALTSALRPGGWLGIAMHVGDEIRHVTELWGEQIDLDFVLHEPKTVIDACRTAGLVDLEWYLRGPNGIEADTERLYVLGREGSRSPESPGGRDRVTHPPPPT